MLKKFICQVFFINLSFNLKKYVLLIRIMKRKLIKILSLSAILSLFFIVFSYNTFETDNSILGNFIERFANFNITEHFENLKNSYNLAKHTRYSEYQKIRLETPRNTQISAFESVLNECATFKCNIKSKNISKNMIFPENIIGTISIEIPVDTAASFANSIGKYGNVVINDYKKDEKITKDLEELEQNLTPLTFSLAKINYNLSKDDVYSFEHIKEMQKYAEHLNKKISTIKDNIEYLKQIKDKRLMDIQIERGYNSTIGFVKSKFQKTLILFIEYFHIIIIITLLYIGIKGTKFIKQKISLYKGKKKINTQIETKIPPRL